MNFKLSTAVIYLLAYLFSITASYAQIKKFDTTVKMGDAGYHVQCSNKNADQNDVSIKALGLRTDRGLPPFHVYGRIKKVISDDFNSDGYVDVAICVYTSDTTEKGTVVGVYYNAGDKMLEPLYFPDIYLDAKIREGYRGNDEFSALTGTLIRKFPVYLTADTNTPTGGIRTVQYKVITENGRLSFKVLRWFDVKS